MSSRSPRGAGPLTGRTLARPFGIELQVHASWLIALVVLTYAAYQGFEEPRVGSKLDVVRIVLAVALGIAIAASIVIHELSHSLTARVYGLPVRRITLFALGGVSQIEGEAPTPSAEFAIALAGPLSSVVLAVMLGAVGRYLHPHHARLAGFWGDLGWINLILALFNLIPAFPMDGGRLLRSGLWFVGGRARATRWAVGVGRAFAVLAMGGGGALLILPILGSGSGGSLGALWIILIGLFIFNAAGVAGRVEGGDRPNEAYGRTIPLPGVQTTHRDER
ncbi:MAG TPA: site-2 protease family protein [Actinomycetota bacterium]|nr:site-2 protease family protein [Actinomycetota bacterium]